MFASEFFELGAKRGELFLHQIGSNLGYIFTQHPILILQIHLHSNFIHVQIIIKKKSNPNQNGDYSNTKEFFLKNKNKEQTLAAAAFCKPPIPGLLLILSSPSYGFEAKEEQFPYEHRGVCARRN